MRGKITIGSTMPIVTTMDAGATIAAAVHPGDPGRAEVAAAAIVLAVHHPLNDLSHHSLKAESFLAR